MTDIEYEYIQEVVLTTTPRQEVITLLRYVGGPRSDRVHIACDSHKILIGIKSPYHDRYVNELKALVPATEREWSPENRIWIINATYFNGILELCRNIYGAVSISFLNNAQECAALSPMPRPRQFKAKIDLNSKVIAAIQEITKDQGMSSIVEGDIITSLNCPPRLEDVMEIIMDSWKDGSITSEEALQTLYELTK
jgi:hypothetical protein